MSAFYLGVDVGGTKTEVCLVGLKDKTQFQSYQILARERMETFRSGTLGAYLPRLKSIIHQALASQNISVESLSGIGIGIPGSVEPIHEVMAQGNLSFLKNIPLKKTFKDLLKFKGEITFDNDANCFALAEAYLGAGATWAQARSIPLDQFCMIGVTLGTGVGGGLLINGEIIRGSRGGAGEVGHTTLIESGTPCYCGKFGCSEQYLSGPAFESSYSARVDRRESKTAKEIFKLAEDGDPLAIATIEYYRDLLVIFLSNLSNLLDPHAIVLGGGLSNQSKIYHDLETRLSQNCFLSKKPPAILQNQAGDSAGVLGAALLSFSKGIR